LVVEDTTELASTRSCICENVINQFIIFVIFSDDNSSDSNENTLLNVENGAGESLESDAQRYQQKLKMLQMRAGWDQHKKPGETPTINSEQPSNLIPTLRITSPPQKHFGVS